MRHLAWSVLFTFLLAPAASATEIEPAEEAVPEVAPAAVDRAPESAEMQLEAVQIEERGAVDGDAANQLPPRGSFWWVVGVAVVAGVILAVIL